RPTRIWKWRRSCQSLGDGARFPAFFGVDRRRCCRSGDWLGFRPLAVDVAVRSHRVFSARLCRRRGQCGEVCGRGSRQALSVGGRQLGPGRFQSMAELTYEFVASTVRNTAGAEGMKFFPLIFSLFMFICISNLVGIIPYTFTVSSHIIVTAALALLVFFTVLI